MIKKIIGTVISSLFIIAVSMTAFAAQDVSLTTNYGPGMPLFFNGEEMLMPAGRSTSQMMSFVITTKNGAVIVIDGGTPQDAEYLKKVIRDKGNHVSAWFITHPHSDHAGALNEILKNRNDGPVIDKIYYNFLPSQWAYQYEPGRAGYADEVRQSIESSGLGQIIHRGDVLSIDSVTFEVMNDPYLSQYATINNSSVVLRATMGKSRVMFLGDMAEDIGTVFLQDHANEDLHAELVQMAHHGQAGVGRNVYEAIKPVACLWCAPAWLYDDTAKKYKTAEVRNWMKEMGVNMHFCVKNGDVSVR